MKRSRLPTPTHRTIWLFTPLYRATFDYRHELIMANLRYIAASISCDEATLVLANAALDESLKITNSTYEPRAWRIERAR